MYSVEGRENKKAEKNEKQRSEEKYRNSEVQILAYAHALKYFLHEIFPKSYCSVRKCISGKI